MGYLGSSPLARGLRVPVHDELCRVGIIPARAGFTAPLRPSYRTSPDHPRSRGIYAIFSFRAHKNEGSSPLARGLHRICLVVPVRVRIIPARAGFTGVPTNGECAARDHPRSRGVYAEGGGGGGRNGSSPLARGLRLGAVGDDVSDGIIPARAGFTTSTRPWGPSPSDHPRSRGVYVLNHGVIILIGGSSPLARGLPVEPHLGLLQRRIIPARAGFTAP